MQEARLLPGKEKLPLNRHPWVYSGALVGDGAGLAAGLVAVRAADGRFVAYGHCNPGSKIRIRLVEWREKQVPDAAWYEATLKAAITARRWIFADGRTDAARLVFGEADGLPGLVIDRFGPYVVMQIATAGMESVRDLLVAAVAKLFPEAYGPLSGILERSDGDGRRLEGLPPRSGLLWGTMPAGPILIRENGLGFEVDLLEGQKTGFYADQRENRAVVAPYLQGRQVMDVCCYTGGFSLYALAAGAASATLVDSSPWALEQAGRNLRQAGFADFKTVEGNAFQVLRDLQQAAVPARPDAIILDPPKLAPNRSSLEQAMRGYKDLNFQAMRSLPPGGLLATFSCSGLVTQAAFREMVAYAAKDARRSVRILRQLHQSSCHPIPLAFPEAEYLKGLLLLVE